MSLIDPFVMLWLNGKYDPIIKFREWYRLRSAVWDVKKTVGKKILEGEPLEVVAAELASNIPRLDQLANAYQGGEPKEFPRGMLFSNRPEMLDHYITPQQEDLQQMAQYRMDGPTRRCGQYNGMMFHLRRSVFDYGQRLDIEPEKIRGMLNK